MHLTYQIDRICKLPIFSFCLSASSSESANQGLIEEIKIIPNLLPAQCDLVLKGMTFVHTQ